MIDAKHLPIVLPEVEKYLPTEDGLPPLGNAAVWAWDSVKCSVVSTQLIDNQTIFPLELNTMQDGQEVLGIGCVIWMRKTTPNLLLPKL